MSIVPIPGGESDFPPRRGRGWGVNLGNGDGDGE
ncbi:hypothetical protein CCACVL1_19562 [Corchorus capsularis]|uniref:Uncharacterized protein n=1 Tax=Corchorus capsularis TaxID=210143 RepID=A0A1R3HG73_COCAP|nr:hypothetical protein CCACVL1_19562 [Corchorus capsularis]